jgi:site-specific DNA-methyltransferase (adenine-specific)
MTYEIHHGDNLNILKQLQTSYQNKISLIYIDPPFNTHKTQVRKVLQFKEDVTGDRKGFGDKTYSIISNENTSSYNDDFDNYEDFLIPRIKESLSLLADDGSIFLHIGVDEVHYAKVALDKLIGRNNFINQIVWASEWGAKSKSKYSNKCDYILWYAKNPKKYIFNYDEIDRVPYLAPDLAGDEKAKLGKTITNNWFISIEGTNSSYRKDFNYPTMKPMKLMRRIVSMHSKPGQNTLDFFAGSGSFGDASLELGRNTIAIDANQDAIDIIKKRFSKYDGKEE